MSLVRRTRRPPLFRIRRFFRRLRRNAETNFSGGNRLDFYADGGEFFAAFFAALGAARHSICAEFYIIHNDATGRHFADLLLAAAARGVSVSLLYDYIGCFDTPARFFRRLERGGVHCIPFNPPPFRRGLTWFDKRDHRKICVIDGRAAFVAGLNIGNEYGAEVDLSRRWRDVGLGIEGPAVDELLRLFRQSWREEGGAGEPGAGGREPAAEEAGADQVMIVAGGPHLARSFIRAAFRMAIAGAAESVRVMNPYFIPGPRVLRSLLRAAARGVRVQLLLPAVSDVPLVRLVSRGCYGPLLRGGIEIYERQGTVLHGKVMLVDGYWTVIGSANLDHRSFHRNYEVNVVVDSHDFGAQVTAMFERDLACSRPIRMEEYERRGWTVRLVEWLAGSMSWFL